jgi:hypothetical protein
VRNVNVSLEQKAASVEYDTGAIVRQASAHAPTAPWFRWQSAPDPRPRPATAE